MLFTSPWVPAEWIAAHGLEPRGVWRADACDASGLPMGAGVCAFAQAVLRLTDSQRAAAAVFTTHCDQMRRGFDVAAQAGSERLFLFNLPATWQTPAAGRIFRAELQRLSRFLIKLGGHEPSPVDLFRGIEQRNTARQQLLEAAPRCPARAYAEAVARFHWDGEVDAALLGTEALRRAPDSAPIALAGGPLPRSHLGLLDALERAGGRVALNATEAGERSLWHAELPAPGAWLEAKPVSARQGSDACDEDLAKVTALDWLTRNYLDNCVDVFQRPNSRLYAWIESRLVSREIKGIVLWHFVGCDLWRAEAQSLRSAFGLPVLLLDADEVGGTSSRTINRIEAFLESLRNEAVL